MCAQRLYRLKLQRDLLEMHANCAGVSSAQLLSQTIGSSTIKAIKYYLVPDNFGS
jgi:hypothetical protein